MPSLQVNSGRPSRPPKNRTFNESKYSSRKIVKISEATKMQVSTGEAANFGCDPALVRLCPFLPAFLLMHVEVVGLFSQQSFSLVREVLSALDSFFARQVKSRLPGERSQVAEPP